ncbi:MAG: response regulator [Hyphomicrobiales bacterium]|nr:response regulator [Hyphomicrobiales bacterium]MBV9516694.1 response regulator [Hyphomicrobiales bacterium]
MEPCAGHEGILPLKGARLLVVEDDFLILMELESVLLDAGAEIIGLCRTLKEALEVAETEELAAAILDIRLGRETVAPAATRLSQRGVPFVFYTGQDESDPVRAQWPGCTLLHKPAEPRKIVAAICALL